MDKFRFVPLVGFVDALACPTFSEEHLINMLTTIHESGLIESEDAFQARLPSLALHAARSPSCKSTYANKSQEFKTDAWKLLITLGKGREFTDLGADLPSEVIVACLDPTIKTGLLRSKLAKAYSDGGNKQLSQEQVLEILGATVVQQNTTDRMDHFMEFLVCVLMFASILGINGVWEYQMKPLMEKARNKTRRLMGEVKGMKAEGERLLAFLEETFEDPFVGVENAAPDLVTLLRHAFGVADMEQNKYICEDCDEYFDRDIPFHVCSRCWNPIRKRTAATVLT